MASAAAPDGAEQLTVSGDAFTVFPIDRVPEVDPEQLRRRPRTLRIVLENLVRNRARTGFDLATARDLANGAAVGTDLELPYYPYRVIHQDFTGVPVLVDLATMRSAAVELGIDPLRVNPVVPVDLVVDHSVQVDSFGSGRSLLINLDREYDRNSERYRLFRWAQKSLQGLRVVPPGNGIVHQVNLEYLASVVAVSRENGRRIAFPDTLIGTDSHTTMVNGLGVLGWGVGGIEAEAVMMGEPHFLPVPDVVGVRLVGALPEGATATDLVLTVTHVLRQKGVVEKFVEFFGPGVSGLSVPDRATISNMCPEYGATAALFPVDAATIRYLEGTGRPASTVALVEAYARRQGLWVDSESPDPEFADQVEVDLGRIVPTISGPKNPEEAVALPDAPASFRRALEEYRKGHPRAAPEAVDPHPYPSDDPLKPFSRELNSVGTEGRLSTPPPSIPDGSVVIAAITSCTNTSNPSVMVGAGLIAQKARARGLSVPAHVKTSLAPGSKVVTEYLASSGLLTPLSELGFDVVGYGCTTCIGNSGPLPAPVEQAVRQSDAYVVAVLSGNRNFEARIHNLVRANYLASPMLVVAYALAGRIDIDLAQDALGTDRRGKPVYLRDLWPSSAEIRGTVERSLRPDLFREKYRAIFEGDSHWEALDVPDGVTYPFREASTYLREPPYFRLPPPEAPDGGDLIRDARALVVLGDRISTDHISPAGEISVESPAAEYLRAHGVPDREFNTYGSRRGNHEVMVRGTFANVRLRNRLVAPREGGWTVHLPSGDLLTVFDAAERYRAGAVPLLVLAGASYGQGSSRDWAAKGPRLLGVRAVLARSFERIHRSNLVGMGILPLEFAAGSDAESLGLSGRELFRVRLRTGESLAPRGTVEVEARSELGESRTFATRVRIDSAIELEYYRAGGLLPYVANHLRSGRAR